MNKRKGILPRLDNPCSTVKNSDSFTIAQGSPISQKSNGHGFDFVDLKKGDEYGIEELCGKLRGIFCRTAEPTDLTLAVTVQYS